MRSNSAATDELESLRSRIALLSEREDLLTRIDETTRSLTDPEDVLLGAATILGRYLHVNRCAYADVEPDQDTFNLTGNYVDRLSGRLLRVSWQDQSDKIQSITVQWEPIGDKHDGKNAKAATVEELCIHIYKQRKKINLSSEKDVHRPFVSVGRAR